MLKKLIVIIALLLPLSVMAASVEQNLQQQLSHMHSMSADFKQRIYDQQGHLLDSSQGKLAIQRPNRFSWQVLKPLAQSIITNGHKVWIYEPDLKQVTVKPLGSSVSQTPILLLSSDKINLANDFTVQQQSDGSYLLTPKKNDESFASVQLWFKHDLISRMQLKTHVGQLSRIDFSNVKLNVTLASDLFSPSFAKDVTIVNQ